MESKKIYDQVSEHYSNASRTARTEYSSAVAKAFGYTDEDLAHAPEGSNLGLSCGNPVAMASIQEGETVIDFGSGAGFDVFQAAKKVGPSGRVFGVDMNKDMLAKATKIKSAAGSSNVSFVESSITDIGGLDSAIADCILSNCVINLVPADEKLLAFHEMFRLLKPGGRIAISDILAKKPLPEKIRSNMAMYVGCIAGASQVKDYEDFLREAGFRDVRIIDTQSDLNVYTDIHEDGSKQDDCCSGKGQDDCCGGKCHEETGSGSAGNEIESSSASNLNEWAGSFRIYAVKN